MENYRKTGEFFFSILSNLLFLVFGFRFWKRTLELTAGWKTAAALVYVSVLCCACFASSSSLFPLLPFAFCQVENWKEMGEINRLLLLAIYISWLFSFIGRRTRQWIQHLLDSCPPSVGRPVVSPPAHPTLNEESKPGGGKWPFSLELSW